VQWVESCASRGRAQEAAVPNIAADINAGFAVSVGSQEKALMALARITSSAQWRLVKKRLTRELQETLPPRAEVILRRRGILAHGSTEDESDRFMVHRCKDWNDAVGRSFGVYEGSHIIIGYLQGGKEKRVELKVGKESEERARQTEKKQLEWLIKSPRWQGLNVNRAAELLSSPEKLFDALERRGSWDALFDADFGYPGLIHSSEIRAVEEEFASRAAAFPEIRRRIEEFIDRSLRETFYMDSPKPTTPTSRSRAGSSCSPEVTPERKFLVSAPPRSPMSFASPPSPAARGRPGMTRLERSGRVRSRSREGRGLTPRS